MKRYSLSKFAKPMQKIDSTFKLNEKDLLLPNYNIHPGNIVPIIKFDKTNMSYAIERSTWGYKRYPHKYIEFTDTKGLYPRKVKRKVRRLKSELLKHINFTLESLSSSKQLNKLYYHHSSRCLIPATSYFKWQAELQEWKVDDQEGYYDKTPYLLQSRDEELFFFVGFTFKSETGKGHAIITTKPNKKLQVFGESTPIVLNFKDGIIWLNEKDPLKIIHKSYKKFIKSFSFFKVSKSVNRQTFNNLKCIKPI